ncbi:hypothetical protein G9A89_019793 [Geosiphon pyriformis]|nr:hypothetical protein G9A89_019793 [Geosiphon pyriformis]
MAVKAKNSKKQQQAVITAMVTLNSIVVPDEIFGKISTVAASPLSDMDGNSSSTSPKMGQDQPLAVLPDVVLSGRSSPIPIKMKSTVPPPVSGAADGGAWENVNVASNLVPGTTFKIKMALLGFLFQLLPGCIGLKSESLNGATKVAISDEVFLTTLKIAQSSGVAFVSSSSLSVVLHNVPLGTSFDDIKTALGIFGVVTSVKLKPAGLWQYAVVNFKDIFSAAAALSNWSVLVKKDSVRILPITNQKRCQNLNHLAIDCNKLPSLPLKLPFNTFDSPKNFKSSFVGSKFYAKAAAFLVPSGVAAADMDLNLGGPPKTATLMLPAVSFVPNSAVKSRLASLESHLSELSVLIKSLVEPVSALVALVTKLLSTPSAVDVSVKEYVDGLTKQNKNLAAVATMMQKRMTCLEKICKQACLEDGLDGDNIIDDVDNDDNTFNVMMQLWEDQSSKIKSSPNQTAKWMNGMVKNNYELVSIMGKMYELDMFDTLGSKAYTIYYFDQAYFEDNFEEKNNSINQLLYSTTFEQQPPDFEYLNHQIHIWIAAHQATETPFETEEESYQTAPVFDLLSSKLDSSTQTVTPEPMANNPIQANILAALQGIQTALERKNNTPLSLFRGDTQNPIEWLDDFERAATANQYDKEYKFQIIGGYLQDSPAIWFLQETDANAQH